MLKYLMNLVGMPSFLPSVGFRVNLASCCLCRTSFYLKLTTVNSVQSRVHKRPETIKKQVKHFIAWSCKINIHIQTEAQTLHMIIPISNPCKAVISMIYLLSDFLLSYAGIRFLAMRKGLPHQHTEAPDITSTAVLIMIECLVYVRHKTENIKISRK